MDLFPKNQNSLNLFLELQNSPTELESKKIELVFLINQSIVAKKEIDQKIDEYNSFIEENNLIGQKEDGYTIKVINK